MKSNPKPDEFIAFESNLRRILSFTKDDMKAAEAEYQRERATHPKRGPKRRASASDRASGEKD